MKLTHIFEDDERGEVTFPRVATRDLTAAAKARAADPNLRWLGTGVSAYVSQSKSPHQMDNVERISSGEDGTTSYLEAIVNTPAVHDNPFLPKVRSVKREGDLVSVISERLYPYDSKLLFTQKLLEATWERITSDPFPEDVHAQMDALEMIIEQAIHHGVSAGVHNDDFKQAIEFIRNVRRTSGGYPDIHAGNLMWRMTGTMPQLVITDPLA